MVYPTYNFTILGTEEFLKQIIEKADFKYAKIRNTKTELIKIFNNEKRIEDMLSLPEGSCKGIYDIYKITLKKDQDIKNIRIFESRIAPSKQGTVKRKGGAKQILVPNRRQWTAAVKIEEFKIE